MPVFVHQGRELFPVLRGELPSAGEPGDVGLAGARQAVARRPQRQCQRGSTVGLAVGGVRGPIS